MEDHEVVTDEHTDISRLDTSNGMGFMANKQTPLRQDTLIERDGMDYEEATEYIDYNCLGAWIGEQTPIIVMPIEQ